MDPKPVTQEQLDAMVGSALRALVSSGASNADIGRFAAEHRREMSQILGLADTSPEPPDLRELVMSAVSAALSEAGIGQNGARRVRYNIEIDKKRTSITLSNEVLQQARAQLGAVGAKLLISSLAAKAPTGGDDAGNNRSMWVEERLAYSLEEIGRHNHDDATPH